MLWLPRGHVLGEACADARALSPRADWLPYHAVRHDRQRLANRRGRRGGSSRLWK